MNMEAINPVTGSVFATYEPMSEVKVKQCIDQANAAQVAWGQTALAERSKMLLALAEQLDKHLEEGAALITQCMGKPIALCRSELQKCSDSCRYYADNAEELLQDQAIKTTWDTSYVSYQPLGVILAIMPWNYPMWQVIRCLLPIVLVGNALVLSHAPIALPCAMWLKTMIEKAKWPKGLFDVLVMPHALCAKAIAWPQIKGVTLTGSIRAGSEVAALAGRYLKPCVMELGGSDPYIVLEDADVEKAAAICVQMRLANSGQVCISAKRLIVVKTVYKRFLDALIEQAKKYRVGDPMSEDVDLGPLAREDLRQVVHDQVTRSVALGAKCHMGGQIPKDRGFFYPVTLLTGVTPGMPAFDEEVFGPVLAVIEAKDEADAILLANQTDFGLGACIFSGNWQHANELARTELQAGFCTVNGPVSSHVQMPFGGIKQSGFGRELGREGLLAFANIKTVCVAHTPKGD